ncbi:GntR family transcriptional regulator [Lentibacillus kapialis]|uniref:GntR family transcriptional regulator n=1 Tax=Lentibacillus kapialis TaxID=340214 RepID=A0A917V0A3_9BACI|nr:GntR family transcriptional regulator [Lentibacillus kapialis]
MSDQVYEGLKLAVISLELSPGQKVRDAELAEQFNVSRTPVREALKRLEDEGLVISTPGSLTRISEINTEEVKQTFVVAADLHALAAKLAVPSLKNDDYRSMEDANKHLKMALIQKDITAAIEADDAFHNVFLQASGNSEIINVLNRLLPKLRRLEYLKFDSFNGEHSVKDHENIIQAGKAKQHKQVVALIEQNWLSLGDQLIE